MVEVMKIMETSFKMSHEGNEALSVPNPADLLATADLRLHQRLLDTHEQVWVSLMWDHCSLLLGPGVHKVLSVPSKSLFPLSCVSSGSCQYSSVQFSHSIVSDSLQPHELQNTRPPCPSPTSRVYTNSCPLS